jgi:PAS domain-containing protein
MPEPQSASPSTAFLARLTRECPDAVIYADAAGHIRFWNAAATRIFGCAESEAIGARLDYDDGGSLSGIAAFLRDATARFEETRAPRRAIATLKGA